jgi:hypothetical protein
MGSRTMKTKGCHNLPAFDREVWVREQDQLICYEVSGCVLRVNNKVVIADLGEVSGK